MNFQEWLKNNTILMERTIINYLRVIERFLGDYDKATVENINKFISQSTRKSRSYYVKFAFKYYLEFLGRKDDYKEVVKVKERPKKKPGCYLSDIELLSIVNNIEDKRFQIVALIQYLTGARAGDVLGFNKDNLMVGVKGINMRLHNAKGGKEHMVFLPEKYSVRITQFIKTCGRKYPFLLGDSDNLRRLVDNNYRYYYDAVKQSAIQVGFPKFSTHDFRRNFLEDVFDKTKDIRIAQLLADHSDFKTTLKYLKKRVDEDKLRGVVEELRG